MQYIDTHAHYTHRLFDKDREVLMETLLNEDVEYIVECGTDTHSNRRVIDFIKQHPKVYGVIGFFPTSTDQLECKENWNTFVNQLNNDKIIGIGEIGLDYYHKNNPNQQKKWFIEQLKLAKKVGLPVCIHSRDAEKDTLDILKNNGKMNGVIHCYSYGTKAMRELVKLGYYFGIGGTCTYKNNVELREAIKQMPLDRIVLETDCPYLTPAAIKHERNDSGKIRYVIEEIAKLKNITTDEVISATNKNVRNLYPKMFVSTRFCGPKE